MQTYRVDVHYTASLDGCQCVEVEAASETEAIEAALHAFDRHSAWEESRVDHQFRLVAQDPEVVVQSPEVGETAPAPAEAAAKAGRPRRKGK